jgi:addiction module RelE/StbE family toxin
MFKLVYAEAALRDIESIYGYLTDLTDPDFAKGYLETLRGRILSLERNAHRFRERSELGSGCRALIVPPYLIFYRLDGTTAYIQRVLHGARNIQPDDLEA